MLQPPGGRVEARARRSCGRGQRRRVGALCASGRRGARRRRVGDVGPARPPHRDLDRRRLGPCVGDRRWPGGGPSCTWGAPGVSSGSVVVEVDGKVGAAQRPERGPMSLARNMGARGLGVGPKLVPRSGTHKLESSRKAAPVAPNFDSGRLFRRECPGDPRSGLRAVPRRCDKRAGPCAKRIAPSRPFQGAEKSCPQSVPNSAPSADAEHDAPVGVATLLRVVVTAVDGSCALLGLCCAAGACCAGPPR